MNINRSNYWPYLRASRPTRFIPFPFIPVHLRLIPAAVLLLCSFGCAHRPSGQTQNVFRSPLTIEPAGLDPSKTFDDVTSGLLRNIFEGLVRIDENNHPAPCLAASWKLDPAGTTYTFALRPGIKFHNGRAVTAADVKYSLERALSPSTRSTSSMTYLGPIVGAADVSNGKTKGLAGVKVIDDKTIALTIDRPRGYFLQALAYPTGFVVCREAIANTAGAIDERSAVGTGPFRLAEYRRGSKVILEAFKDYWGGRPKLDRIERPIVIDPQTRHLRYENGELDYTSITTQDFLRDSKDPRLSSEIHQIPLAAVVYVCMHPRLLPQFKDVRVRRAIAMAIDRDEIARVATHGLWPRADGIFPPGVPGSDPNIPKLAYDPVSAKQLFKEAGYPGGRGLPPLTLVYSQGSQERGAAAQIIRDRLQTNLGITVNLQEREGATFVSDRRAQKMPFYVGIWVADYIDPQNFISTLLRSGAPLNSFGYSNSRVDELCDRADAEADLAKRIPLYQEADRIAMGEVAILPLLYQQDRVLFKPYVQGWKYNLLGLMPDIETRVK